MFYNYEVRAFVLFNLVWCLTVSCRKAYDDAELRGRTIKLEQQISVVENNVRSLQALVNAKQSHFYITSVEAFTEGFGGYTIRLSNGETLKVYNGSKGADGRDGIDGKPGRDGTNATNPIHSVDVSNPDYILFALADGTSLSLPRTVEMSFSFSSTEDFPVFAGHRYEIPYTTTGLTSASQIKVIAQDGYQAKLYRTDERSGRIDLLVPTPAVDSEVIVLLSDGKGGLKMYAMSVYAGKLTTNSESYLVDQSGGSLNVFINTNTDYSIEIPEDAHSWLRYEGLRSLTERTETLHFTLRENPNSTLRSTVVKFKAGGTIMRSITIVQKGESGLEAKLNGRIPSELKLTDRLTPEDFKFLRDNSYNGSILDLSDLDMTELPEEALRNARFQEVILPKGLRIIPRRLMYYSSNLSENNDYYSSLERDRDKSLIKCSIPRAVTHIEEEAFQDRGGLTGVLHLPDGLNYIGDNAFRGCEGLTGHLVIPNSVAHLGEGAFSGCLGLEALTLPEGLVRIPSFLFFKCSALRGELNIPNTITEIGAYAFYNCSFSGTLTIPNSVREIAPGAFRLCSGFTKLYLPSSVQKIGAGAFSACSGLKSVLFEGIPTFETSGVSGSPFRSGAFLDFEHTALPLDVVYCKSTVPQAIPSDVFWSGEAYGAKPKLLYVPIGCKGKYEALEGWNVFERIEEMDVEQMGS